MIDLVLVATDGSRHAQAAVDLGALVAAKYEAKLVLLHVTFGSDLPDELLEKATRTFEEAERSGEPVADHPEWPRQHQIEEFAGRMILQDAETRAETWGVEKIDTLNDFGSTSERIIENAHTLPADLVVMGTRGHSEVRDFVLGGQRHSPRDGPPAPCPRVSVGNSGQKRSNRPPASQI